jgi:predicted ATPase
LRVERLTIARYRSLYGVSWKPGDFSVLVGPNNSGKTNLVDAIDFLAEAYRFGLEIAIGRKGGFENIAHRKMRRTKSPIEFAVTAKMSVDELRGEIVRVRSRRDFRELRITHTFGLAASSQAIEANYSVVSERATVDYQVDNLWITALEIDRNGERVKATPPRGSGSSEFWSRVLFPFQATDLATYIKSAVQERESELLVGPRFFNPILAYFARSMATTRVYQLVPLEGRRAGVPTPNPELDRHGANLPAFVAQLRKNPRVWSTILETMRRVVPGLTDIDTDFTPDRRLTLRFHELNVGRPWGAEEVSDGTIQTLSLLAALFDPRTRFVLIEEPENSVHPWIVRNFLTACRSVSDKQIVLTTHSPILINNLAPEEVLVVWKSGGETHVSPLPELDAESVTLWNQGTTRVFDLLDTGWLPQAVPGPRH